MNEIDKLMDEELVHRIKSLKSLSPGSQEETEAVKNLTALYEARSNEEKLLDQKKERWIRVGTTAFEVLVPLACYGAWFAKGLKFEETGSITSSMMRNLMGKFRLGK